MHRPPEREQAITTGGEENRAISRRRVFRWRRVLGGVHLPGLVEIGREGDGRDVRAGDAEDGAVEVFEGFFADDGGKFGAQAHGLFVLVHDQNFVGLAYGIKVGFLVERGEGAKLDDLGVGAALGHLIGGIERHVVM